MNPDSLPTPKEIVDQVEELLQATYEEKKEFNDALNGATPISVPSLIVGQGPHQLEASEILFWTDRDAYNDEFASWEPKRTLEVHQQSITQLKTNGQVPVLHDLVDAIRRNRVAPFIGAGFSRPCDFPLWGAALHEIFAKITGVDASAFKAKMDAYEYLGAAQLLWEKDDAQVKSYIRTRFADGMIPTGGVQGPIKLLPRFSRGCVITTNFDRLIEITIGSGQIDGYMHGTQAGHMFVPRLLKGDRCILKLHGDAANYNTYVFTEKQYSDSYGTTLDFSKPLPRALRQIFVSHSLLFLGCSMEQDRTLELFQKVCDDKQFEIPDHFAILPLPTDNSVKQAKESRLLKLNVRTLWYPPDNNHELLEKYLALAVDMAEGRITSF
jgi:hypothetical protein